MPVEISGIYFFINLLTIKRLCKKCNIEWRNAFVKIPKQTGKSLNTFYPIYKPEDTCELQKFKTCIAYKALICFY